VWLVDVDRSGLDMGVLPAGTELDCAPVKIASDGDIHQTVAIRVGGHQGFVSESRLAEALVGDN